MNSNMLSYTHTNARTSAYHLGICDHFERVVLHYPVFYFYALSVIHVWHSDTSAFQHIFQTFQWMFIFCSPGQTSEAELI